ncbi:hypothetical protein [Flavilitoribacter nigricans]|uniref:Uncharacterized protein n=1 Tax=Flavilitoribacter nigricans (strain ATCC 23147 / DSM 23189 / NBRC 102662 / NCIMB 1420 / SS-2) TaxID=1122177 RepID=A0A2D0NFK6_FLAN2|nr:hypothetical protein [Flavilitoribacter nigricans]PHN07156.1 hypothetical protein CRP01_07990 [Flavilitoribacter nigricans DSM 23189 = NBRC 102662]
MKYLGKVLRIHLLVLLAYSILIMLFSYLTARGGSGYDTPALYYAFIMLYAVGAHAVITLIIMIIKFVKGEKELGVSHLISLFIVGVIGFSSCLGGGALLGG